METEESFQSGSKRPPPFKPRTICFTAFNIEDPKDFIIWISTQCLWVLGQEEKCPETGRLHVQGMAHASSGIRWKFMHPHHI